MRVDIVTIFPDMVKDAAACSIVGRAQTSGILDLRVHDLRNYTHDKHRATDDAPFGGGAGMVMTPAPLFECVEAITSDSADNIPVPVFLMAPDGERFNQKMAREISALPRFVILCGHYEGLDERVREALVTREISVGDYVLTGGELPALTILDATTRLLPGVVGNAESIAEESFSGKSANGDEEILLEYPHYTRPADFRGMIVPGVLLSGHHANIVKWRRQQALTRTRARRPDLWNALLPLGKADQKLVDEADAEVEAKEI